MVYSGIHEAEDRFFNNKKKYKPPTITKLLFEREDIIVSWQGVARVLKIFVKETGTIDRRRGVTVRLQRTASCQQISTPPLRSHVDKSVYTVGACVINAVTAIC